MLKGNFEQYVIYKLPKTIELMLERVDDINDVTLRQSMTSLATINDVKLKRQQMTSLPTTINDVNLQQYNEIKTTGSTIKLSKAAQSCVPISIYNNN